MSQVLTGLEECRDRSRQVYGMVYEEQSVGYRRKKSAAGLDNEQVENHGPYKPDSILYTTCIGKECGRRVQDSWEM